MSPQLRYYYRHHEKNKEYQRKRRAVYYEAHKDEIKAKNLARYHAKKTNPPPANTDAVP